MNKDQITKLVGGLDYTPNDLDCFGERELIEQILNLQIVIKKLLSKETY